MHELSDFQSNCEIVSLSTLIISETTEHNWQCSARNSWYVACWIYSLIIARYITCNIAVYTQQLYLSSNAVVIAALVKESFNNMRRDDQRTPNNIERDHL